MSIYVFLGPSLPVDEARAILDAVYLPPAAAGDVYEVVQARPRAIALIDGLIDQVPAVRHSEILRALEVGARVFGSAGIGALRAVEMRDLGMEGMGRVYEAFKSGELSDDDEISVAMRTAEGGFRPLSDPMISLRDGLALAAARGAITADVRDRLTEVTKRRFFPERSWAGVLWDAQREGVPAAQVSALREFVRTEVRDVKREDARQLLRHLAQLVRDGFEPHQPTFRIESPFRLHAIFLEESRAHPSPDAAHPADVRVSRRDLGNMARVALDPAKGAVRAAFRLSLLVTAAVRAGILPFARELEAYEELMRRVAAAPPGAPDVLQTIEDELFRQADEQTNMALPLELQRRGELAATVELVTSATARLAAMSPAQIAQLNAGLTPDILLAWYARRMQLPVASVQALSARVGTDPQRFINAVATLYAVETAASASAKAETAGA